MDNDEVEFIAENELITVIPNFQYKTLYLIGVGKFLCFTMHHSLLKRQIMFLFLLHF